MNRGEMMQNSDGLSPLDQLDKFKQAARDLECNEDETAFKRLFRAVAKAPVEKKAKAK
jgi:hypothetical protein